MHTPPAPPPQRMGLGAHASPGHGLVHPASLRPPHVPAPASRGTLLPGVLWSGLMAPRHPVACGCRTLRTGVWISPDTVLSQRHAARLPHPTRAPSCRPPTVLAQPRLYRGHRPHPYPSPGAGGRLPTPSSTQMAPGPSPRPSCGHNPQTATSPPPPPTPPRTVPLLPTARHPARTL